jgi:hypothetical protein
MPIKPDDLAAGAARWPTDAGNDGRLPLRWELAWGEAPVMVAGASVQPAGVAGAVQLRLVPQRGDSVTGGWVAAAGGAVIAGCWP